MQKIKRDEKKSPKRKQAMLAAQRRKKTRLRKLARLMAGKNPIGSYTKALAQDLLERKVKYAKGDPKIRKKKNKDRAYRFR